MAHLPHAVDAQELSTKHGWKLEWSGWGRAQRAPSSQLGASTLVPRISTPATPDFELRQNARGFPTVQNSNLGPAGKLLSNVAGIRL